MCCIFIPSFTDVCHCPLAGVNPAYISTVVVPGEIAPEPMRRLLHSMGMRRALTNLCLASFGGNLLLTARGIDQLLYFREKFTAGDCAPSCVYNGVASCFAQEHEVPLALLLLQLQVFPTTASLPRRLVHTYIYTNSHRSTGN